MAPGSGSHSFYLGDVCAGVFVLWLTWAYEAYETYVAYDGLREPTRLTWTYVPL